MMIAYQYFKKYNLDQFAHRMKIVIIAFGFMILGMIEIGRKFFGFLVLHFGGIHSDVDLFYMKYTQLLFGIYSGRLPLYDDGLLERVKNQVPLFLVNDYLTSHGWIYLQLGKIEEAIHETEVLMDIEETYKSVDARLSLHIIHANTHFALGKYSEAIDSSNSALTLMKDLKMQNSYFNMQGIKVWSHISLGNLAESESVLSDAEIIRGEVEIVAANEICIFTAAKALYNITLLEDLLHDHKNRELKALRNTAKRSAYEAVNQTAKLTFIGTICTRLLGTYYWIEGKRKRAFSWWKKSIELTEKRMTPIDKARTCFEIGRRMKQAGLKYSSELGMSVEGVLQTAEAVFREYKLEEELAELQKIKNL